MAALVIWEQTATTDRDKLDTYRKNVYATLVRYGGKVLCVGAPTAVEGAVSAERIVVIEFENLSVAHAWYGSAEYAAVKALRHEGAQGNLIFVG